MRQLSTLLKTLLLLVHLLALEAFVPLLTNRHGTTYTSLTQSRVASLYAKKRRRRKEQADEPTDTSSASPDTNELPDFVLKEEAEEAASGASRKESGVPSKPDEITAAMMGSGNAPMRSVNDLISDRSFETKFVFEEEGDEALPDLVELMRGGKSGQQSATPAPVGKKKARKVERKAAALAREEEEEGLLSFITGIPFLVPYLINEETGKVTYVKVVESGTWLCIYLLVGWEIYINSPFYDRAAPIAPVVF
mmetsp:Transcript_4918/g.6389  ORF Transcript_4918/g.6389 Transcript_4918/m.6389 type:complete len:251 (-) Transcript_4918:252-1004(-)